MKRNLYDVVGVPPVAPREMIAAACRRRIAKLEGESTDEARAEIFAIKEAWSILGDDKLRAGYDASLAVAAPGPAGGKPAAMVAELEPDPLKGALFKPRHWLPENWERYRKLVFALLFIGIFALSAAWNQSRRLAYEKRINDANYEAEFGEPRDAKKAAMPEEKKPAEPFSAEKFEKEMREREAELKAQVEKEQVAKEDEFRQKLERDNTPEGRYSGRRRTR
jgi:curved DNA-binding protein CbpA